MRRLNYKTLKKTRNGLSLKEEAQVQRQFVLRDAPVGPQLGRERIEAGRGFTRFATKKRLEIFAPDELAETIVAAIMENAHTGRAGDGKLYVMEVLEWGRIRTGERGR